MGWGTKPQGVGQDAEPQGAGWGAEPQEVQLLHEHASQRMAEATGKELLFSGQPIATSPSHFIVS